MTYQQPVGYSTPGAIAFGRRPTYVTVLAIIGIVWAVFGLIGGVFRMVAPFIVDAVASSVKTQDPTAAATLQLSNAERIVTVLDGVITLALAILLLVASIFSLKMKPGYAKLMLNWAYAYIASIVLVAIITIAVAFPAQHSRMSTLAAAQGTTTQSPQSQQTAQTVAGYGSLACSSIFFLIFPIFVIIFFRRPLPEISPMGDYGTQQQYQQQGYGQPQAGAFPPSENPNPDASRQWQQQDPNDPPTPPSDSQWPPRA